MIEQAVSPRRYANSRNINVSKVLTWIRSGELRAVNLAVRPEGRPRWKLTPEAIAEFEAKRSSTPPPAPPPRRPRRRFDAGVTQYFQ
jgi:hypothetical protein